MGFVEDDSSCDNFYNFNLIEPHIAVLFSQSTNHFQIFDVDFIYIFSYVMVLLHVDWVSSSFILWFNLGKNCDVCAYLRICLCGAFSMENKNDPNDFPLFHVDMFCGIHFSDI